MTSTHRVRSRVARTGNKALYPRAFLLGVCVAGLASCSGGGSGNPSTPPPGTLQFGAPAYDVEEGTGVEITVSRSGGSEGPATVSYATSAGTAVAGVDYAEAAGTLSWADGVSGEQTITIDVIDDVITDAGETFSVTLSNATGATLGAASSTTVTTSDFDKNAGAIWVARPSLADARWGITSCDANDKIYLFGGAEFGSNVEEFDPAGDVFTTRTPIPTSRRFGASCVYLNGQIYLIGGYSESNDVLASVDIYDPVLDVWSSGSPMSVPRYNVSVSAADGKIYAVGGRNGSSNSLDVVEEYSPQTDSWETKSPLPVGHHSPVSATMGDMIYVIGGFNSAGPSSLVYEYDPAADVWEMKSLMPTARSSHASSVIGEKIYVFGGTGGGTGLAVVEEYEPATDTWIVKTDMPARREAISASRFRNVVYVFGGRDNSMNIVPLSVVESYAPVND